MTAPMLAQPGDISRLRADQWAFEGKWDGVQPDTARCERDY
jgi:hypothetical protein